MTIRTTLARVARPTTVALLLVLAVAEASRADKAPDSIGSVQTFLSDSVSLGNKVVYIDFWASWCAPCRRSLPWMQALYDTYHPRGLEIVGVCVDKDHSAALKFIEDTRVTFPVVFDSTGSLAKRFGLDAMPTSFLYGRDGRLVLRHVGFQDDKTDSLRATIRALLKRGESE